MYLSIHALTHPCTVWSARATFWIMAFINYTYEIHIHFAHWKVSNISFNLLELDIFFGRVGRHLVNLFIFDKFFVFFCFHSFISIWCGWNYFETPLLIVVSSWTHHTHTQAFNWNETTLKTQCNRYHVQARKSLSHQSICRAN